MIAKTNHCSKGCRDVDHRQPFDAGTTNNKHNVLRLSSGELIVAAGGTRMNIGHFFTALLASGMAAMTIIGTQAMTGRENAGALLLGYGGGWFLLFAIAAILPMLFSVTGRKSAGAVFIAFGAGGAIAGGLIAGLLLTHNLGGSPTAVILAFAIPFTLPWIVGVAIIYFRRSQASRRSHADR